MFVLSPCRKREYERIYSKLYLHFQTSYIDKGTKPDGGKFLAFDHLTFYVGNAKQAASYYIARLGFQPHGYQGLETGNRKFAKHAVKQNQVS